MRVAFPMVGETVGGSHVSAALLMAALPAAGFDPVAVVHRPGVLVDFLAARGLPFRLEPELPFVQPAGAVANLWRLGSTAVRLARWLRAQDMGLVHANDARMTISWMPAARLAGLPGVAHQRTRFAPSRLSHLGLAAAQRVICISDYVRATLPSGLQGGARVLFNPFEADAAPDPVGARARLSAELGLSDGTRLIAFIGTLQDQKRPEIFVEAAARLARSHAGALAFLMFGRQPEGTAEALLAIAGRLGIGDRVRLMGFRPDMGELLAGCDQLWAPAVNEGHGRALIEAMLAGVPVVAVGSGGHGEVIDHGRTGLLVLPDNPAALAAAGQELLASPVRAGHLAAAAGDWARATFSVRHHAEAVAALYADVLS